MSGRCRRQCRSTSSIPASTVRGGKEVDLKSRCFQDQQRVTRGASFTLPLYSRQDLYKSLQTQTGPKNIHWILFFTAGFPCKTSHLLLKQPEEVFAGISQCIFVLRVKEFPGKSQVIIIMQPVNCSQMLSGYLV